MKIIKKIIVVILLVVVAIILLGIGLTSLYGEKIEEKIFNTIKDKTEAEIQVKNLEFSIFKNFPYTSVKLTDILIMDIKPSKDTLLYSNEGFLYFNLFNLILNKKYINKILLVGSKINIKYDQEGKSNFKIFKTEQDKEKKVIVDQIYFTDSHISFVHLQKNIAIKGNTYKFLLQLDYKKQSKFSAEGNLFMQNLLVNKTNYVQKKEMKINASFSFSDSILYIYQSEIFIEDVQVNLSGTIKNNIINLTVMGENQKIRSVLTHMPEKFKTFCNSFTADGNLNCKGKINGVISRTKNPHFNMDFNIDMGKFKLNKNSFNLIEVSIKGNIDNGKKNNFENTLINAEKCSAKMEKGTLNGSFKVSNLNNYYLSTDITSNLDLTEVNNQFKSTLFSNMKGNLVGRTRYNGLLSFSNKMKNNFLLAKHQSDVELQNVEFRYRKFPLVFGIPSLNCQIQDNKIIVANSDITISDSDFKFDGTITNFIPYLLNASSKIEVNGKTQSIYIKFDELITLKDISERESRSTMPNWIETNLKTKIDQFSYQNFSAKNITTLIEYSNHVLKAKNLKMNTLNGKVEAEAKFYEKPYNYLKLFISAHLEKINIRNLFTAFQNFKQDFIQDKNLKGEATADVQLKSSWNPGFAFDPNKLMLNANLIINKGELVEFAPLLNLSSYVSIEELKDVKFSTLENNIRIEHNTIRIPSMKINSSALSLFISGNHSFDNEIDYNIRLLLSELISKKFRKKNTHLSTKFGVVEDDGLGYTTLYLKMTGNVDQPNIYFDRIKIKEKLNKEVKKEVEEIKKIVKETIFKKKTDSTKTTEDKSLDVILEWKDEMKK